MLPMSELNTSQQKIADTLEGMIVVDAGPGTGKTHTIVRRYLNLVSREGVTPRDVLLLTFTRNAATEMEERIKTRMAGSDLEKNAKLVQVKTFDAFCLSVVMDSPEDAGRLFGIDEKLTHSVKLVENETLNRKFFFAFLDEFMHSRGEDYGDWSVICEQNALDLYKLINRLMSRGVYPLKGNGWFGDEDGTVLNGHPDLVLNLLDQLNISEGKPSKAAKKYSGMDSEEFDPMRGIDADELPRELLISAAKEDRSDLFRLIHDVYWHYIRRSISEDRLTFGINAMLAFSILYMNSSVRAMNSYRYLMIDEFQDTNSSQLMLALLIMKEPNLCVVGDWKQGIYGFRYVSIDNIVDFDRRVSDLAAKLNDDTERICFRIPSSLHLPLEINYRSSQTIVDESFRCLKLKATGTESYDFSAIEKNITYLEAGRSDIVPSDTAIRYVKAESRNDEAEMVARCIRDYVCSGRYRVMDENGPRPVEFGDIAVLCRNTRDCRTVLDTLEKEDIPGFLQGDMQIMNTREAKLVLAWLRYINNSRDPWGFIPLMVDLGYCMADCEAALSDNSRVPPEIVVQRGELYSKRRRITELVTNIFSWYGISNDISQTIINVLSGAHRGSLLTISDLIDMLLDDMMAGTTYPVECDLSSDPVSIMTMHKSKGLEFPIVIIPYMDYRTMPSTAGDKSIFVFDDILGIRCKKTVGHFEGYSKICKSWRTQMASAVSDRDYDEERRLMFVAMSRAKQYVTAICGEKPSEFMKGLSGDDYAVVDDAYMSSSDSNDQTIDRPDVSGYRKRTATIGVHSIMDLAFEDGQGGMTDLDEVGGKGREYGNAVHLEAQLMHQGVEDTGRYPETKYIRDRVLSRIHLDGFLRSYAEVPCSLPVCEGKAVLKGQIDLLLVFEDRIEVHDYKTDETDRFQDQYELQLSVYAHAAKGFYRGLPVRCFIDYVSQERTVEFEPLPLETVDSKVCDAIEKTARCIQRTPNILLDAG